MNLGIKTLLINFKVWFGLTSILILVFKIYVTTTFSIIVFTFQYILKMISEKWIATDKIIGRN